MFDVRELARIDRKYFDVIRLDVCDVMVRSRNTGHVWEMHSPDYTCPGACTVFHKHREWYDFHRHGAANSLGQAIRNIKSHDRFQIEVRGGG